MSYIWFSICLILKLTKANSQLCPMNWWPNTWQICWKQVTIVTIDKANILRGSYKNIFPMTVTQKSNYLVILRHSIPPREHFCCVLGTTFLVIFTHYWIPLGWYVHTLYCIGFGIFLCHYRRFTVDTEHVLKNNTWILKAANTLA